MSEKPIQSAQELTEALEHPPQEARYVHIGNNWMESIDALDKIFSQQVQGKIQPNNIAMSPPRV